MERSAKGDSLAHIYGYSYDALGRLQEANYSSMGPGADQSGRFTVDTLAYDLNGNIMRAKRRGAAGVVDDLTYRYQREEAGNQLLSVSDTAPKADSAGYPAADPSEKAFAYGPNGNRIADSTRGQFASYNYFNVPDTIRIDGEGRITWTYAAGGEKLTKTSEPSEGGRVTTHYVGGFVYESSSVGSAGVDTTLRYTSFSEGRIVANGDASGPMGYADLTYEYHLTDHLGNTRIAFEPDIVDSTGTDTVSVTQRRAYYPYGMRWARQQSIAGQTSQNEHLYNGKELAEELGLNWYHYGARYYDVALARWAEMDPADEFHSPYTYVGGDPVNRIDPDGRQATSAHIKQDISNEAHLGQAKEEFGNQSVGLDETYVVDATFRIQDPGGAVSYNSSYTVGVGINFDNNRIAFLETTGNVRGPGVGITADADFKYVPGSLKSLEGTGGVLGVYGAAGLGESYELEVAGLNLMDSGPQYQKPLTPAIPFSDVYGTSAIGVGGGVFVEDTHTDVHYIIGSPDK